MIKFSVTQNGQKLNPSKYNWNEKTRAFSTTESNLVIDFGETNNIEFKTGAGCTFKTGAGCTFKTDFNCTFKTGPNCTFKTGWVCTFNTGYECTFKTDFNCTFNTGSYCNFNTGSECTFNTGWVCTFNTGSDCTFTTGPCSTFKTGINCFVTRYDVKGCIEIPENTLIKLNECQVPGFTIIEETPNFDPQIIHDFINLANKLGYKVIPY